MSQLVEAVLSFDGKHVSELRVAARGFDGDEAAELLEFCASGAPRHRVAATWIVKAVLEAGGGATLDLWRFFSNLAVETEWEALLHLLQSVQFAPEPASAERAAIEGLLGHEKALVAVWALDALVRVAIETGEGLDAVQGRVDAALSDKRASKRARARHLAPLLGL